MGARKRKAVRAWALVEDGELIFNGWEAPLLFFSRATAEDRFKAYMSPSHAGAKAVEVQVVPRAEYLRYLRIERAAKEAARCHTASGAFDACARLGEALK